MHLRSVDSEPYSVEGNVSSVQRMAKITLNLNKLPGYAIFSIPDQARLKFEFGRRLHFRYKQANKACAIFLDLGLEQHAPIHCQPLPDDIDERPLRIALEEVRPDFEHGKSNVISVAIIYGFRRLLVKVNDCVCFFDDTLDPV